MPEEIRQQHDPRIFFDEPVTLFLPYAGGESVEGRARNISQRGMFVQADRLLPESTPVGVRFELPDGLLVFARAKVVRQIDSIDGVEPEGMALYFETFAPDCREHIAKLVEQRLRPPSNKTVRLEVDELDHPIRVQHHSSRGNVVSVAAELPFLRLGSQVTLPESEDAGETSGSIRWVSVHTPSESGVPRINIGIEMAANEADVEEYDPDADTIVETPWLDTEEDPICTQEFVEHSRQLDKQLRTSFK